MSAPLILVVGSSNTDMIIQLPHLPRAGETILGGPLTMAAGGKGANQAVAAARAGGDVSFIAKIGGDVFGDKALAGFKAAGIRVERVLRAPRAPSGVALIFVDQRGQNSIAVASGANQLLAPADLRRARPAFRRARMVVLQLETPLPTVAEAVRLAAAAGARVILNPAPAQPLPPEILRRVFVLTPNECEAELLAGIPVTGLPSAARAARVLLARGVRHVILTMGPRGALLAGPDGVAFVPAHQVKAVDTTAAGDVFNGALAVALAEDQPLHRAVCFASAAAALSVSKLGAQTSAPSRARIEALLRRDPIAPRALSVEGRPARPAP